jgi:hypothetical protein
LQIVGKRRYLFFQRRLPLQQRIDLLFDLPLVEPVHDAIGPHTQVSNLVFRGDFRLSHWAGKKIIAKREITAGRDRPHCHDDQRGPDDDGKDCETLRRPIAPAGWASRAAWLTTV